MTLQAMFEPFRIGLMELPNRIIMAPMSRYVSPGGVPTAEFASYHARRAAAGVGLVMTGATGIERLAANNDPNLARFHGDALPAWRRIVQDVHAAGGRIGLQLWHAGAVWNRDANYDPGAPIESPSAIGSGGTRAGQAMSEEDIADVIAAFALAASDAKMMGFDIVEIHAAHGYLIDQFFWNVTNVREDRWGGNSIEERARFGIEVVKAVREAVGADYPISLRISQWKAQDYAAKPIQTPEELAIWLAPFADAGVDVFHCSQRRFYDAEFDGSDLNLAGWVRKLTGKPVITAGSVGLDTDFFSRGRISQPTSLAGLITRLERGDFDLVAVGRALLTDPEWIIKVREGRIEELQPYAPGSSNILT